MKEGLCHGTWRASSKCEDAHKEKSRKCGISILLRIQNALNALSNVGSFQSYYYVRAWTHIWLYLPFW